MSDKGTNYAYGGVGSRKRLQSALKPFLEPAGLENSRESITMVIRFQGENAFIGIAGANKPLEMAVSAMAESAMEAYNRELAGNQALGIMKGAMKRLAQFVADLVRDGEIDAQMGEAVIEAIIDATDTPPPPDLEDTAESEIYSLASKFLLALGDATSRVLSKVPSPRAQLVSQMLGIAVEVINDDETRAEHSDAVIMRQFSDFFSVAMGDPTANGLQALLGAFNNTMLEEAGLSPDEAGKLSSALECLRSSLSSGSTEGAEEAIDILNSLIEGDDDDGDIPGIDLSFLDGIDGF